MGEVPQPPVSLLGTVAWRFVRGRRSRLLDGTARTALLATALGVTAMVIGMAVMTGYRQDLSRKLMRGNAALLVYPLSQQLLEKEAAPLAALEEREGVDRIRRVTYGQGTLSDPGTGIDLEVSIRGTDDVEDLGGLSRVVWRDRAGEGQAAGSTGIVVGEELAAELGDAGETPLRLMVLGLTRPQAGDLTHVARPRFRFLSVHVAGTFSSGLSEFDRKLLVMDREKLEELTGSGVGDAFFEVLLEDAAASAAVGDSLRRDLGPDYLVMDWRELNRELFTALKLQQIALFLVLGLIVLVSTFNVASSLVVLVRERMKDIGVLAALGLAPEDLRRLFLLYGGALSLLGVAAGVALGSGVSWILTRYELIRFDPELASIYFLSSVPLRVRPFDLAAVTVLTLGVTVLACWLPARRSARVLPAEALRYE